MNNSAQEPSGDSPPPSLTADRLREQIREHMARKNQAIYDDMMRERSSTQVPRIAQPPEPAPEAVVQKPPPLKKAAATKTRRARLRGVDFDHLLAMIAQDCSYTNSEIARLQGVNKNAVSMVRQGKYRGMSPKQRKRARELARAREKNADEGGCRPMDLPPNLSPSQMREHDEYAAKTQHTLYEGHPMAGKSKTVTDDKPQLSAVSKPPPEDMLFPPALFADAQHASPPPAKDTPVTHTPVFPPADPAGVPAIVTPPWGAQSAGPASRRENGVGAVLDLLDRQQRQQAEVISDLVAQVRGLLK